MLKKCLAVFLTFLALQGCAVLTPDYSNLRGVEIPVGDLTENPVPITLSVYESFQKLQEVCQKADALHQASGPFRAYFACAITWYKGCAIAIWKHTAFEVLGHETLHCLAAAAGLDKRGKLDPHFQRRTIEKPE